MFEALKLKPWSPPSKLKKQESIRERIIYYCSNCECQCFPVKAPLVENKVMDKIEVSF